jgi:cytochrome c oxidase cbb3-type subunit III
MKRPFVSASLGVTAATAVMILFGWAAQAAITEPKIRLPHARADMARGQKLFQVHCALCHGPKGEVGRGPLLTRARLGHAPDDATLLKVIEEGIRGTEMPGAGAMSSHEIRQTAAYVRSLGRLSQKPVPGNVAQGADIYRTKGNCAQCHSIRGEGGISAPSLTGIGMRRSAAYLRESLLEPAAALPDEYLRVTVVPINGPSVSGMRVNEDSFSIQVRDDAGGSRSFWRNEIREVKKMRGESPMPSYKGQLSDEEITDVVAYLASLKEPQ